MRHFVPLTTVLLAFLASAAAGQPNWPQFRGPTGDGIATSTGLPLNWGDEQNVVWKTAIHDKGWSSPVIWDDQVWMTTALANGRELFAVCVDKTSGKIVHDVKVYDIPEPQYCIELNSYASCTPAIEPGRVYVHYGAHGTACLDTATGKTIWSRQDLQCDHFRGPASSPILYGNLLVVAFDGFDYQYVVAFDKLTGRTVWRRDRNIEYGTDNGDVKKAYGTAKVIEVDGKPQLVYPSAGATIAYEPKSGEEIWRINHGGMNASNPPLFADGLLYLNSAAGGFNLFAMRVDGKGDVTNSAVEWKSAQGVPKRSSAVLVDGLIFMPGDSGIATCLDAKTGKLVWQKRLKGEFSASPVYSEGRVYLSNQEGQTFVVAAASDYELLATNELADGCMASAAVSDQAIYLRTKTHLYRLENK